MAARRELFRELPIAAALTAMALARESAPRATSAATAATAAARAAAVSTPSFAASAAATLERACGQLRARNEGIVRTAGWVGGQLLDCWIGWWAGRARGWQSQTGCDETHYV